MSIAACRLLGLTLCLAAFACEANDSLVPIKRGAVPSTAGGASAGGAATAGASAGGPLTGGGGSTGGGAGRPCSETHSVDRDGDGYAPGDGDCNDCDAGINAGALDLPDNGIDEDCSGAADEPESCDDDLAVDADASGAARALGICRTTSSSARGKDRRWGLIAARFVFPDGTTESLDSDENMECVESLKSPNDLSHGILKNFGANVVARQGKALLALSTGVALAGRQRVAGSSSDSPEGAAMCTRSLAPAGFPFESEAVCGAPDDSDIRGTDPDSVYDAIALELVVRAPTNVRALTFESNFFTREYPASACSAYSDTFAAWVRSPSSSTLLANNAASGEDGEPICANNTFVEVCDPLPTDPGSPDGTFECPYGTDLLVGTGFDGGDIPEDWGGATGWLLSRADVVPGQELVIRFAIWDVGDESLDSTVLIDKFGWDPLPGSNETTRAPLD